MFGGDKHVCCVFESDEGFITAAVDFLRGGLHRERLVYIADRSTRAALLDDLIDLGDAELLSDEGDLVVQTPGDTYLHDQAIDPAAQIEAYRAMTDSALADGFSGLRVAADATALVEHDANRRVFMTYEIAVDSYITANPMRAMCAYDSRLLGAKALDLACVHKRQAAASSACEPGFTLSSAAPGSGAAIAVTGEVDAANASLFAAAIDAAVDAVPLLSITDDEVVIDARDLSFIDSEGAEALVGFADQLRKPVVVVEAPRSLSAVLDALGWGDRIRCTKAGA